MNPIILVPNANSLESGFEFDCDCACFLAPSSAAGDFDQISGDAPIQTSRPIHIYPIAPDFDLILSPHSRTSLAVINGPARLVLDFFDRGGTLDGLFEALPLPQEDCQQAAEALWQAGFLRQH